MGLNFQYHDGLQPKIRAGIINEHECNRIEACQDTLEDVFRSVSICTYQDSEVSK